ncbi:hypothetical protein EDD37DRAFT_654820 [Exophiala viscosa]|uniref:Glycine zipper 2TM domain-containing protein n=1 Tax=Exophiala viscosa TaxID=2486360 RepID=A0AAN6DVU4_9EURO|nr:hypothetical protein EDD36DRAFT_463447 [Exophiala viscosa]KAI1619359.1 hypothetical protein EDD37DRAFT_654820 [Exophiala viscosa]
MSDYYNNQQHQQQTPAFQGNYDNQQQGYQVMHQEVGVYDPQTQTHTAQSYTAYDMNPNDNVSQEGDRGLLGGVAGAVAGGATGNKLCHGKGFLGALGGGMLGSIVEDVIKKKRSKQDLCHNSRPCSPQPPQTCHQPPQQVCYPPQQQYQGHVSHGGGFVIGAGAGAASGHSYNGTYAPAPGYRQ